MKVDQVVAAAVGVVAQRLQHFECGVDIAVPEVSERGYVVPGRWPERAEVAPDQR